MREIKFKAKRVSDGEWVEGYYLEVVIRGKLRFFIIPHNIPCEKYTVFADLQVEIDPNTLSQFTGLLDKNGNEFYEGDIIRCKMFYMDSFLPHQGTIVYNTDHCTYATKNESGLTFMMHHDIGSIEVIGNIHGK